ncbi:MAG TPA: hypothetical protein DCZ94_07360 [Lentisphaeria bacterium]|nr:MAG: hypothetical protein A2X48_20505 [Lentisphaerae bacterium GWF2_49_21]HBC86753.1 hypothetical protein [Lentisphaeria bacterium]
MKTSFLLKLQLVPLLFFVVSQNCQARLDETVTQCSIRYGKSNLDIDLEKLNDSKNASLQKANDELRKKIVEKYGDDCKRVTKKHTTPDQNGFIFRDYEKNNMKLRCVFLNDKCVRIEYQGTDGLENDIKKIYGGIKEINLSDVKQEYRPYLSNNTVAVGLGSSFSYNLVSAMRGEGFYLFIFKGRIQVIADKYFDSIISNKAKQPESKPKSSNGL